MSFASATMGYKELILKNDLFLKLWGAFRSKGLRASYRSRRERYHRLAMERGLVYRECQSIALARERIRARGWKTSVREAGDVHTFAFIPLLGWHASLYPDLRALGPVSEFDYTAHGFSWDELNGGAIRAVERREQMNELWLEAVRKAHKRRPIDWIFVYASGIEISVKTLERITVELGIPTVNMCLDDKHSWEGPDIGGQRAGQIDLARRFDLSWTSSRLACEWYLVEGGRPIYLPEGFDSAKYCPMSLPQDIPMSFVGSAYGFRSDLIGRLRRHALPIATYGNGWPEGMTGDPARIFNRSAINLGMGGIGYSEELTALKGRDFEVPGCGGGAYLTSYNSDLSQHFVVGKEILCYRSIDELIELARHYLAHPDEARVIAAQGMRRSLAEHRWLNRYRKLCAVLGIMRDPVPATQEAAP